MEIDGVVDSSFNTVHQSANLSLSLSLSFRLKKTKTLTLEAVLAVLLEMKISHDMEKAMRHIPARYWDMIRIGV